MKKTGHFKPQINWWYHTKPQKSDIYSFWIGWLTMSYSCLIDFYSSLIYFLFKSYPCLIHFLFVFMSFIAKHCFKQLLGNVGGWIEMSEKEKNKCSHWSEPESPKNLPIQIPHMIPKTFTKKNQSHMKINCKTFFSYPSLVCGRGGRVGGFYVPNIIWWCWGVTFRGRYNIWWCCSVTVRARRKIGEIWVNSRSTNFGAEEGKISSANGLVQFCNFMVTSWTNCPPLQMTLHAKCVEIKVYLFVASARSGDVGMLLLLAGAPLVMLECHCRGRCNIWRCWSVTFVSGVPLYGDAGLSNSWQMQYLVMLGCPLSKFWVDSRNAACWIFDLQNALPNGLVHFCNFMVASWTNRPPVNMTRYAKCVEII